MTTAAAPALTPAKAPIPHAAAGASYFGAFLSLAVTAAGVIGIRDGLVAAGAMNGSLWTTNAVNWIDGLTFADWMMPAGVAAVIVGVYCVVLAVTPRRTTAAAVAGRTSVVISHRDIARIAESAAQTVPGVTDARATSKRRTVTVRTHTTGQDAAGVKSAVSGAVSAALDVLAKRPRIVVRTRTGAHS